MSNEATTHYAKSAVPGALCCALKPPDFPLVTTSTADYVTCIDCINLMVTEIKDCPNGCNQSAQRPSDDYCATCEEKLETPASQLESSAVHSFNPTSDPLGSGLCVECGQIEPSPQHDIESDEQSYPSAPVPDWKAEAEKIVSMIWTDSGPWHNHIKACIATALCAAYAKGCGSDYRDGVETAARVADRHERRHSSGYLCDSGAIISSAIRALLPAPVDQNQEPGK